MSKKNFDSYLIELDKKMNKYKVNDKLKKTFFEVLKKTYDSIKNSKQTFIKSESYISAKNDVNLLINGKTDIKKKYNFYMDKIIQLCIKYKLNENQVFNLVKYFYEKSDISKREQLIFSLKRSVKEFDNMTKLLKEIKKKREEKEKKEKKEK
jgi:truncated hemoglobin YjbI